jgi:hypothetical protein
MKARIVGGFPVRLICQRGSVFDFLVMSNRVVTALVSEIVAHLAELPRALCEPALPAFLFLDGQRMVAQAIESPMSHLACFGCRFGAALPQGLRAGKRLLDQATDCIRTRRSALANGPGVDGADQFGGYRPALAAPRPFSIDTII